MFVCWVMQALARASCRQDALATRAPGRGEAALARDLPWKLIGVDDLRGDGRADILLRRDDGHWRYYGMSGRRIVEQVGPAAKSGMDDGGVAGRSGRAKDLRRWLTPNIGNARIAQDHL